MWMLFVEYFLEFLIFLVFWLYCILVFVVVNGMLVLMLRWGLMYWRGGISKVWRWWYCWWVVRWFFCLNYMWCRRLVVMVSVGFWRMLVLWVDWFYLGFLGFCYLLGWGRIYLVLNENFFFCFDLWDYF